MKVELNPEKLWPSMFGSKDVRPFTILTEFMNKPPRQKASGQDTNGKKANPRQEDRLRPTPGFRL